MESFAKFILLENDHLAFLTGMMGNPSTAALVFADWLEEHDRQDLANTIRIVFENRAGSFEDRNQLIDLLHKEYYRLKALKYNINSYGEVGIDERNEPGLFRKLKLEPNQQAELHFDGHSISGYQNSKPIRIDPNWIQNPNTIEALMLTYIYRLAKSVVKSNRTGNYESKKWGQQPFDSQQRIAHVNIEETISRLAELIYKYKDKDIQAIDQELSVLERIKPIQGDFVVSDLADEAINSLRNNTNLRERIFKAIINHSGEYQLTDLIGRAEDANVDELCPVIAQIANKLNHRDLADLFERNPIQNPLFHVDIYSTNNEYETVDGETEQIAGEPDHEVDDDCDLETLFGHMREFDTFESGRFYNTHEDWRTGGETERVMSVREADGEHFNDDTLEILWKAQKGE